MEPPVRCAVIGYGPMHDFGRAHCAWIDAVPDLRLVAVCDLDPARTALAKETFPHVRTCNNAADIWRDDEVQLVSIVTPHFTHRDMTVAAFEAGKHVVVEKAMCLNVDEATAMVEAGKRAGRMLAVHHNRRHDGNYRRVKEVVESGMIGDVFHVELWAGGYAEPPLWWYSDKAKSGGGFFYWGPHAVDWVLDLIPHRVGGVNGFFHNLVWHNVSNEDQTRAIIRFENGTVADITWSHIDAVGGKPLWRILGTKGGLLDTGDGAIDGYCCQTHAPSGGNLTVVTRDDDGSHEQELPYKESDWHTYWHDIAGHLLRGGPVPVSGEFGRRVIGVLEAAERSSASGQTEAAPYE